MRSFTKKGKDILVGRDGGKGNDIFCDWDIGLMKVISFEVDVMSVFDGVLFLWMMGCDFCMWVVCSDRDALIFRFLFKRFYFLQKGMNVYFSGMVCIV